MEAICLGGPVVVYLFALARCYSQRKYSLKFVPNRVPFIANNGP